MYVVLGANLYYYLNTTVLGINILKINLQHKNYTKYINFQKKITISTLTHI